MRFISFILLWICLINGSESDVYIDSFFKSEASNNLASYGLAYCINYERSVVMSFHDSLKMTNHSLGNDGVMELQDYIYKTKHDMLYTLPFTKCIKIYNSQEYQAEIERIVKKYCKDCK